jgi:hypothetical protein
MSLPVWAGELPFRLDVGEPVPDPHCSVAEPETLRTYGRG